MRLVKENKYKGILKTNILKGILSLGLVGSMMFSLSACNDKEEVNHIDIDKIDYQVVFIKDLNNEIQPVVLDPNAWFIFSAIYDFSEYLSSEYFYSDIDFRLKQNWQNIIETKTECEYVDTIALKPLVITEYGYKKIYEKEEINELIAKIQKEPGKYLSDSEEKDDNAKVKEKTKLSD